MRFIDSDQLLEIHSAATHQPVVTQVVLQYEPPEQAVVVLSQFKKARVSSFVGGYSASDEELFAKCIAKLSLLSPPKKDR